VIAEPIDVFRRRAAMATLRAEQAESSLLALQLRQRQLEDRIRDHEDELARLRAVVESQASLLSALRERLTALRQATTTLRVADLARSLAAALDAGSRALGPTHAVASLAAEIRAAFALDAPDAGLSVVRPDVYDSAALSTFRLELSALPPALAEEERLRAVAHVFAAAADAQRVLERDWPDPARAAGQDAAAQVAAFLAGPAPAPESVSDQIAPVVAALATLAASQSALADSVGRLRSAATLSGAPSAAELDELAAAVAGVAAAIGELSP
jgi:hypothetical protein